MSLSRYLALGALAGAAGTAAMDLVLYRRYRRSGGEDSLWQWEFAGGVTNWDQASAPGKVGEKLERLVTGQQPPDEWARLTTNLVHWATGISWGIQYAVLASQTSRLGFVRALALGPTAWLASYVILPLLNVYKPIWEYDAPTLRDDLSAHLVFGTATSAAFAALSRSHS
jgi:hypothetical protein